MNSSRLVIRSLFHFWKRNLLLALGFSVSTAVLTGALLVGDSVSFSLKRIVEQRLGKVTLTLEAGDRFFTSSLADSLMQGLGSSVSALLKTDGIAVAEGGALRVNGVQVLGVDSRFDEIAGCRGYYSELGGDTVIISRNLAMRLNLSAGDEFLLRMTRSSLVPLNAPFVSDAGNSISIRASIKAVAGSDELGSFNLKTSQTAPYNVFISSARLNEIMETGDRANILLFTGEDLQGETVQSMIRQKWSLRDAGLSCDYDPVQGVANLRSERVFIDDTVSWAVNRAIPDAEPVLTYFVNTMACGERSTPYSFVSTLGNPGLGERDILVNSWLARDLGAVPGDTLRLEYFVVGPLRELTVGEQVFIIREVVGMEGRFADRNLMPSIPGMSDAGNCRDWETGVPVNLERLRDKDEEYWKEYKGTPKAFLPLAEATRLWKNRFGTYTSYRIKAGPDELHEIEKMILSGIDPGSLGFETRSVRQQGLYSAENGVDFSGLFGALSFFLVLGALILTVLIFRLNVGERNEQMLTFNALGIPGRRIRRIMFAESLLVAGIGGGMGIALAILYNRIIFQALNGIWMDIVRTEMLVVHNGLQSLLMGYFFSLLVAGLILWIGLGTYLKKAAGRHVRKEGKTGKLAAYRVMQGLSAFFILLALVPVGVQLFSRQGIDPAFFFSAGGLLLVSGILLFLSLLHRVRISSHDELSFFSLGILNTVSNRSRSMSIVILLALGTFIVISTGSNRKDLFEMARDPESGTGGYLYYAESTVPVLKNLNDEGVRYEYGLEGRYEFVQMRLASGDDASCLNLNRVTNPGIIGVDPASFRGRFAFITATGMLREDDPWATLDTRLSSGLVPAVADETVIKWGLGKKVGDTLTYLDASGDTLKLLLVGGLAPSIFQGSVLISMENFLEHFPASSGTERFLVSGSLMDTALVREELGMSMRDMGWVMEDAAVRLARFNSVTNTYLSIFMVLGAFGLLLGTIGLAFLLSANIVERTRELALLRAVGYGIARIRWMVISEYLVLLLAGTLIGTGSSVIATLPSFLARNPEVSMKTVLIITGMLLLNGTAWIWMVTSATLRNKKLIEGLKND